MRNRSTDCSEARVITENELMATEYDKDVGTTALPLFQTQFTEENRVFDTDSSAWGGGFDTNKRIRVTKRYEREGKLKISRRDVYRLTVKIKFFFYF